MYTWLQSDCLVAISLASSEGKHDDETCTSKKIPSALSSRGGLWTILLLRGDLHPLLGLISSCRIKKRLMRKRLLRSVTTGYSSPLSTWVCVCRVRATYYFVKEYNLCDRITGYTYRVKPHDRQNLKLWRVLHE